MALVPWLSITMLLMIFGSLIVYIIGRRSGRYSGIFAVVIMLVSLVTYALAWWEATLTGVYLEWFIWGPFVFGWLLDGLSVTVAGIVVILTMAATIYSLVYMQKEHGHGKYYALLLLYNAGIFGVVIATNLFQFYVLWELMLIPSYFLIAEWGTKPQSTKIALKYFIYTHVGAVLIIVGIAGMYTLSAINGVATLSLVDFSSVGGPSQVIDLSWIWAAGVPVPSIYAGFFELAKILVVLFTIGFAVKMAVFPIHSWLPDAHAEAPTPISAILSGVMIATAAYAIIRILMGYMLPAFGAFVMVIMIFGIITMFYGGAMALAQKDTKRLFAYSSISQMGYIFFGLGTAVLLGVTGAAFHIFTHALGKGLLFMVAGVLIVQVGHQRGRDINALGGLGRKMPWTATIALIAGLSLAGTPPLVGFFSEFFIFSGAAFAYTIWLLIFAVAGSALTAAYVLWFVKRVFFGETPADLENITESPWTMRLSMLLLAALIIIIGIWPMIIVNPLFTAFTQQLPWFPPGFPIVPP
ncbi:MAG: NuoM family protein [Promethearchaeota archaeon]